MWGSNRPGRFRLFDLGRDPGQFHNVAPATRVVDQLYGHVVARAGGRLPFYGGK